MSLDPTTIAGSIDVVLQRLRDPQGVGTTRAVCRDILSRCQQLVNARTHASQDLCALVTDPTRALYDVDELTCVSTGGQGEVLRVERIQDGGRDLRQVDDWRDLVLGDRRWLRTTADRPEVWARIGLTLYAICPATAQPRNLTVVVTRITAALGAETSVTEVPDDQLDAVRLLAELVLATRIRRLQTAMEVAAALRAIPLDAPPPIGIAAGGFGL